jgi:glycosyltransferase involved in cell wall biosynthesis
MSKVSVVIPSRGEQFLAPTVKDALSKAAGDVEVIPVLDGYWPDPPLENDKRLIQVHRGAAQGMRAAINAGVAVARGEYVMKLDGHCALAEGYDEVLKADCEDNWVVVPRRYSLDAEKWEKRRGKRPIDYQYLSYPDNQGDRGGPGLHGRTWEEKNRDPELLKKPIDDLMTAQGSGWFMKRDYYHWLELEDVENYGTFGSEFQEIGFKVWLSGGRVVRNKKTWYAHLHKGRKYGRGWPLGKDDADKAVAKANTWLHDQSGWAKRTLPFESMIRKFWPVPGWPEDASTWAVAPRERDQ